ncbi:MAG: hypothetical protein P8J27_00925 [Mariniblastus sp.]|nr:hypothetical protein [Mariniblastus sp.]
MSSRATPDRSDLSQNNKQLWNLIRINSKAPSKDCPGRAFLSNEITHQFLTWLPGEIIGKSFCVASSRLGQKLEQKESWFDALRTLAIQIKNEHNFLLTAENTTSDPFVRRLSVLFQIPMIQLKPFPPSPTSDWFDQQKAIGNHTTAHPLTQTIWYRPVLIPKQNGAPNVNDLLLSIAQTAVLLSVRKNGNIFRAAIARLENLASNPQSQCSPITQLLIDRKLTAKNIESILLGKGATGWWLYQKTQAADKDGSPTVPKSTVPITPPSIHCRSSPQQPLLQNNEIKSDQLLIHWTRRRVGPWPDQSTSEFLDDLIFQYPGRHHNQLASLCRILASGRLLASNEITRGNRAVVCFSGIPIKELPKRRIFRPHLSRWDFEPYGIAIDRKWLSACGAKPVHYGDEKAWSVLPPKDRPFFQLSKSNSQKIDWQEEDEWRIVGDLLLDRIPRDHAFVFVGSNSEIERVSELSRWPVVVIPRHLPKMIVD